MEDACDGTLPQSPLMSSGTVSPAETISPGDMALATGDMSEEAAPKLIYPHITQHFPVRHINHPSCPQGHTIEYYHAVFNCNLHPYESEQYPCAPCINTRQASDNPRGLEPTHYRLLLGDEEDTAPPRGPDEACPVCEREQWELSWFARKRKTAANLGQGREEGEPGGEDEEEDDGESVAARVKRRRRSGRERERQTSTQRQSSDQTFNPRMDIPSSPPAPPIQQQAQVIPDARDIEFFDAMPFLPILVHVPLSYVFEPWSEDEDEPLSDNELASAGRLVLRPASLIDQRPYRFMLPGSEEDRQGEEWPLHQYHGLNYTDDEGFLVGVKEDDDDDDENMDEDEDEE